MTLTECASRSFASRALQQRADGIDALEQTLYTSTGIRDPCKVALGADTVIDGYIDRYVVSIDAGAHTMQIIGRGKCCDLVDYTLEYPGTRDSHLPKLSTLKRLFNASPAHGFPTHQTDDQRG